MKLTLNNDTVNTTLQTIANKNNQIFTGVLEGLKVDFDHEENKLTIPELGMTVAGGRDHLSFTIESGDKSDSIVNDQFTGIENVEALITRFGRNLKLDSLTQVKVSLTTLKIALIVISDRVNKVEYLRAATRLCRNNNAAYTYYNLSQKLARGLINTVQVTSHTTHVNSFVLNQHNIDVVNTAVVNFTTATDLERFEFELTPNGEFMISCRGINIVGIKTDNLTQYELDGTFDDKAYNDVMLYVGDMDYVPESIRYKPAIVAEQIGKTLGKSKPIVKGIISRIL